MRKEHIVPELYIIGGEETTTTFYKRGNIVDKQGKKGCQGCGGTFCNKRVCRVYAGRQILGVTIRLSLIF